MRDDANPPNLRSIPNTYDPSSLGWIMRNVELFFQKILAKGPLTVSELNADSIKFPATAQPSTDANTLDDYREGTWTPTLVTATGDYAGATLNIQSANYTKVGRMVHLHLIFSLGGIGSAALANPSVVRIGGIPFSGISQGSGFSYSGSGMIYQAIGAFLIGVSSVGIISPSIYVVDLPTNVNGVNVDSQHVVEITYYTDE